MKLSLVISLLCALYYSQGVEADTDTIICYWDSRSAHRPSIGKLQCENINPVNCTHLIYFPTELSYKATIENVDPWKKMDLGTIKCLKDLKKKYSNLKILFTMGGWFEGSLQFSLIAGNANLTTNLADNIVKFMEQHELDGFEFDWNYPGQEGGGNNDKENFAKLLCVIRERMNANKKKYLLTAAVRGTGTAADISYNVTALSECMDFINLMTYDMHGEYDRVTGQNAPLYAAAIDSTDNEKERCADASVQAWIQRGADPGKLLFGLASYGRTFTLSDRNNNNLGANATGVGIPGPATQEAGILAYYEICKSQIEGGWTEVWDDKQKVPFAYKNDQWVGYDTPKSISIKVEYAKSKNLGGVTLWAIDMDDINGECGQQYPILSAVKETMGI